MLERILLWRCQSTPTTNEAYPCREYCTTHVPVHRISIQNNNHSDTVVDFLLQSQPLWKVERLAEGVNHRCNITTRQKLVHFDIILCCKLLEGIIWK